MEAHVLKAIEDGILAVAQLKEPRCVQFIEEVSDLLATRFLDGKKVLVAGNGGSLCDASHFAEELTGFFRSKRRAFPAIALSEPGHLTCVGNDVGFEEVFSRGVEAYGNPGDIFIGLSTSGNSPNIVRAFERAHQLGLTTVSFLGKTGGKIRGEADYELLITGFSTSDRIQESHMTAIHIIIEMMERKLGLVGGQARALTVDCASSH